MNVEFSEVGGVLHIIDEFRDEREGVGISDGMTIEVLVILTGT